MNLHPHVCSQELSYYMFAVNIDRGAGSCNTLDKLSSRVFVPYETEQLNRNKRIKNINKTFIMEM